MAQYPASGFSQKLPVTKANTAGESVTNASLSTPSGGTSSWVQFIASTTEDTLITGVGFHCTAVLSSASAVKFEIARGGAGSESTLSTQIILCPGNASNGYPAGWVSLGAPQRVGTGERVALRATQVTSFGATVGFTTYITTVPYANLEGN